MEQNIQLCLTENNNNTNEHESLFYMMDYGEEDDEDHEYNQQIFNQNYLQHDENFCMLVDYNENNTIKQLQRICNYYEIKLKVTAKKADIINVILVYESDPSHKAKVIQRKKLWFYLNELKKDKHMKQFVFWS
jgi:hypothetical protein